MRLFGCTVDRTAQIFGRPTLWRNRGKVIIGKRVELHSMASIAMIGQLFPACSFATSKEGVISIGDDTQIVGLAVFAQKEVTIGRRVLIADGCRIMDSNFHPVDQVPRRFVQKDEGKPVIIEDDVWLCTDVTVCPGVRIGKGSVIGAKSVVTSDIPPMSVAGGIPAKVIRSVTA